MAKAPPQNPVLPEHRAKFQVYLTKWQKLLNLGDWRINLSAVPCTKNMAEVYKSDLLSRSATIRLGTTFGPSTEVTDYNLEATAVHELLHISNIPMLAKAREPDAEDDAVGTLEHAQINVLEILLLQDNRSRT